MSCRGSGLLVAALVLLLPAGAVRTAQACGGLFCSRQPVDQTAERIIFSVDDDGTVTARIQIRYVGERDAFAWLLPVAGVPEFSLFPELAVQALDLATEPRYESRICAGVVALDGGGGASGHATPLLRQPVGPFDTVVLEGDTAAAVVTWLRDNDYRISDAMIPYLEPYVAQGLNFVAMKLLPDADVSDIQPIAMTYEGQQPSIPIRLTAVAAQPEMGVIAYILGDRRYEALNYQNFLVDDADIRFSNRGDCNYLPLISRRVDELGGRAFATEYAGSTQPLIEQFENTPVPDDPDAQEANAAVLELLRQHDYVTRLYSRLSAHEMTVDPVFGPAPAANGADVSNQHQLDGSEECTDDPCEFVYCGETSGCAIADREAVCLCAAETTARMTRDRFDRDVVFCEPLVNDLLAMGAEGAPDPCADYDCGRGGECIGMNGNPTCRCGELGSRVVRVLSDGTAGVACETFEPPDFVPPPQLPQPPAPPASPVPASPADPLADAAAAGTGGRVPAQPVDESTSRASLCSASPGHHSAPVLPLALLLLAAAPRAARRRSSRGPLA